MEDRKREADAGQPEGDRNRLEDYEISVRFEAGLRRAPAGKVEGRKKKKDKKLLREPGMPDANTNSNPLSKERLCRLSKTGILAERPGEYEDLVRNPGHLCRKCGRAARNPENLCSPVPMKGKD